MKKSASYTDCPRKVYPIFFYMRVGIEPETRPNINFYSKNKNKLPRTIKKNSKTKDYY